MDVFEVEFFEAGPPSPPVGVTAVPGEAQVTLTWSPGSGDSATGYRVFRNGVQIADTSMLTYTDSVASGTHTYYVVAYNASGSSGQSASVMASPLVAPDTAPEVTVGSITDSSSVVSWPAVPEATGYRVYLGATQVTDSSALSHTLTGLTPSTGYFVKVVAYNAIGSGPEGSASFTTASPPPVPAPTAAPSSVTILFVTSSSVGLQWDVVPGAEGYVVYRDGLEVDRWEEPSHAEVGLAQSSTYVYTVAAYTSGGVGPLSDPVTVTTPAFSWSSVGANASRGGAGLAVAASDTFTALWPYILGLLALVYLAFWVLGRVRRGASGAR